MKSLFAKSVVFFLVLTTSRCAPGRLGTIDLYDPSFFVNDYDDVVFTIATTESDGTAEGYDDDDYDVTDATTNETPLESPVAHIDQLAGQDGTTEGQYVNTDKTGRPDAVVDVAGPSPSLAAHTADE